MEVACHAQATVLVAAWMGQQAAFWQLLAEAIHEGTQCLAAGTQTWFVQRGPYEVLCGWTTFRLLLSTHGCMDVAVEMT